MRHLFVHQPLVLRLPHSSHWNGNSFRWMKLFLLIFLLLYTEGVQEHQQATWLSDHSQLTNSCIWQKNTYCTHWSRLLQLGFTTICLPLNPCSCQTLNSICCQGKCFHSIWRNVSKTRHAWLSRKVTPWTFQESSVLFVSILSGSSFQVHVSPYWRCGQFACNKILLHSPYKMKQYIAYSVLVRPRKPVCDNQYYWKGRL